MNQLRRRALDRLTMPILTIVAHGGGVLTNGENQ